MEVELDGRASRTFGSKRKRTIIWVRADPLLQLALCDDYERSSQLGTARLFNHKLESIEPGRWAKNAENRKAIWPEMLRMVGAKE